MQKHKAIQHFNWLTLLLNLITYSMFIANEWVSQISAEERHFQKNIVRKSY